MDQIAGAIWTFGRVVFGADRRRDCRVHQSVASMALSEPSELQGFQSDTEKKKKAEGINLKMSALHHNNGNLAKQEKDDRATPAGSDTNSS